MKMGTGSAPEGWPNEPMPEFNRFKTEPEGRQLLSRADFADISKWLDTAPPERKYVIEEFIAENITAVMNAAGGVGKSNLILLMCVGVAAGINIAPFRIKRPRRVLLVNVEDSSDDIWRRLYALGQVYPEILDKMDSIKSNLLIFPGRGKVKPLMGLVGGAPVVSEDGIWMVDSIMNVQPEFAVFDTKSRLYGLEENSNDHAAQWWSIFERVITDLDNGCTVLISSHSSKAGSKTSDANSHRGAKAFIDNARLNIVLSDATDDDARTFGIDPLTHFSLFVPKTNYTKKSGKFFFEKTSKEGIPRYSPVAAERFNNAVELLFDLISEQDGGRILKRELESKPGGKKIRDEIKEEFGFDKKEIRTLIGAAYQDGKIREANEGRKVFIEVASYAL